MEALLCYECGHPISEVWDAFELMKRLLLEADKLEIADLEKRSIDPELNQDLTLIFDALGINNLCCRNRLTSAVHIHNF
jgi:DNA-directed RNA polymerase subunit N (RpoN/RPB10)